LRTAASFVEGLGVAASTAKCFQTSCGSRPASADDDMSFSERKDSSAILIASAEIGEQGRAYSPRKRGGLASHFFHSAISVSPVPNGCNMNRVFSHVIKKHTKVPTTKTETTQWRFQLLHIPTRFMR
jgi:hypothetical protein